MSARPKSNDPAILDAAARKLLPEVREWLGKDRSPDEEIVADLIDATKWGTDGYSTARRLDNKGWSVDFALAEILDGAWFAVSWARDAAVKAWVAENKIVLAFAEGAIVKTRRGTGPIVGLRPETAEYVVATEPKYLAHYGDGVIAAAEDVSEPETVCTGLPQIEATA